jgi:coproporphyrinogen III oxidase-like Fe-S oxidoreductase
LFASRPPPPARRRPVADDAGGGRGRARARRLERYEVSACARPAARCRHNLNYWRFGDYLGIGAGAHGKVSFPDRSSATARCAAAALRGEPRSPATAVEERRTLESPTSCRSSSC